MQRKQKEGLQQRNQEQGMQRKQKEGLQRNQEQGMQRKQKEGLQRNQEQGMQRKQKEGLQRNQEQGLAALCLPVIRVLQRICLLLSLYRQKHLSLHFPSQPATLRKHIHFRSVYAFRISALPSHDAKKHTTICDRQYVINQMELAMDAAFGTYEVRDAALSD